MPFFREKTTQAAEGIAGSRGPPGDGRFQNRFHGGDEIVVVEAHPFSVRRPEIDGYLADVPSILR
jgi:hypothetical protein